MGDLRIKKLPQAILDNKGSVGAAMREVGYSEAYAQNPQYVTRNPQFQKAMRPILERLAEKRDMALEAITKDKLDKSSAKDATTVVDVLTKNLQLLSGKPTERINTLSELSDEQLAAIAKGGGDAGTGPKGTGEETPD